MKRILKNTYHTAVFVLFLAIALAGFTQTKTFRSYLRNILLEEARGALNGVLELGPLEGNLVTGFQTGQLRLQQNGIDVLAADRLEARYDLWALLTKRISLRQVTLVRPRVSLWRSESGRWNFEQLLHSEGSDSSSSPWLIDIGNAELLDATVSVVDSLDLKKRAEGLAEPPPPNAIDYSNLRLHSFTLRASTTLGKERTSLSVRFLGFQSRLPDFTLENLIGDFTFRREETSIKNLVLRTKGSQLKLSAALRNVDLTTVKRLRQLEKVPVELSLTVDRLDCSELKQFLPKPLAFLDKSVAFDLRTKGTFGRLRVEDFTLRTPRIFVKIGGWISNLHQPDLLELDLAGNDNILHPEEAMELLPGLHLPNLRSLGTVDCNLAFAGRPDNFKARVEAVLSSGTFGADASVDLRRGQMIYDATVTTVGVDLAELLGDKTFKSALNTTITIKGSGTSLQSMTTVARAEIDSSTIFNLPVRRSVVVLDLADKTLRSRVSLDADHTHVDLTGRTTFHSNDTTSYLFTGNFNSLNLAEVLRNEQFESDLSFTLSLEGSGTGYSTMQSKLTVEFGRSVFQTEPFENRSLVFEYDASDSLSRVFTFQSDAAEVAVVGVFTPPDVIGTVQQTGALLANAISHRFNHLDSLRKASVAEPPRAVFRHGRSLPPGVNAKLKLTVKDFHPLGIILGSPMTGSATLEASMHGTLNNLALNGIAEVDHFSLSNKAVNLDLVRSSLTFDLSELQRIRTLESLHSLLVLRAEQLSVDSLLLSSVQFDHRLVDDSSHFSLSALLDSLVTIDLEGTSQFRPNKIYLNIPRLTVRTSSQTFDNEDPLQLVYGKDGFSFTEFSLRHEAETITLAGWFDPSGISDIRFSLENSLLTNLKSFSRNPDFIERVKDFGGIVKLNGSFSGSMKTPRFFFDLSAQGTRVGDVVFGQIIARASYADGLSNVFVEFRNRPEEAGVPADLFISGIMPLDIGSVTASSSEGMDLSISSRSFRLEFLDPFIPILSNLTGTLICDVKMRGTLLSPSYEGSLSFHNAGFFFAPLGMSYGLNGKLVPQGRNIALQDFSIRNIPEDLRDGLMNFAGTFTLEGIQIKEFDLLASGTLKVMKEETSRRTAESMYGDIVASSGPPGLRWNGTPDRSFFSGNVLIKYANLVFPPSRDSFLERNRTVTVSFIDDTAQSIGEDLRPQKGKSLASSTAGHLDSQSAAPSSAETEFDVRYAPQARSFLDNIVYNLGIQTQGATQVRFVFNAFTNEELSADLQGRLVFIKDGDDTRLTGELEVGSRSYYKYFKSLNASGKLLFTGEPTNPELEILAKYEGTYQPDTAATNEQKVTVTLEITGTREEPKVKIGIERRTRNGDIVPVKDASSDAIAFLISGSFRDEMTAKDQRSLLTTSLAGTIGSSLLSGPLTELVRKELGFVSSVDVIYYGGNQSLLGETDIRVTGEVGEAVIRFGGRVLTDPTNANVSIQLPMSSIMDSEAWRNLIFELERRVEGGGGGTEQPRASNGIKLLYRISF